uniref:Pentacotripeptide-repeat region of PRORP domain-containing protein n=1 Tax=Oryza nivara TaxID=4536 RepID=A0A0E0FXB3_ORYNI
MEKEEDDGNRDDSGMLLCDAQEGRKRREEGKGGKKTGERRKQRSAAGGRRMAASRRLARKLPSLISKHQRLISPEIDVEQAAESPASSSSIPLDPSLPILPLAVSHLSPPSPLPALPSAHASTPAALLRILRRARHHPRLAALDLHLLLAAASDSPAFRPDHRLTSLLAARLAESRRLPSLRRLLELVLFRPCPCTDDSIFACPELLPTFRKAILAFAASGDIPAASDALASLRRAADSPLPAEFYNIILHALARLRRHEDTVRFYGEMTSTHRVHPDVYTFNILINSSCRAEGVDAAMRWFQEMRRWSCSPTGVSFNTLMRGFFREGRCKEGIKVAREMLQLGFGLSVASMEIMINGLCRGGEPLKAAEALCEAGRTVDANRLRLQAKEKGFQADGFTYSIIVQGFGRQGIRKEGEAELEIRDQSAPICHSNHPSLSCAWPLPNELQLH